jgi:hypothetical protein
MQKLSCSTDNFQRVGKNTLINEFGFYVISRLHTSQNMLDDETDIDAFGRHATLLHDGTRVNRFSKDLLAFLQTLVAFCPFNVANDPNAAAPMDSYYAEALRD